MLKMLTLRYNTKMEKQQTEAVPQVFVRPGIEVFFYKHTLHLLLSPERVCLLGYSSEPWVRMFVSAHSCFLVDNVIPGKWTQARGMTERRGRGII